MLKRMAISSSRTLKRIADWLDDRLKGVLAPPEPDPEPPPAPVAAPEPKAKAQPVARIAPHERGIQVQCASCGVLHTLEVVCHNCGEPLCDDTYHCRRYVRHLHLERNVVVCPTCYSKAPHTRTAPTL